VYISTFIHLAISVTIVVESEHEATCFAQRAKDLIVKPLNEFLLSKPGSEIVQIDQWL
jgi:hypothetical protein